MYSIEEDFFYNLTETLETNQDNFVMQIDELLLKIKHENFYKYLNEYKFEGWTCARFNNGKILDIRNSKMFYLLNEKIYKENYFYKVFKKYDLKDKRTKEIYKKIFFTFSFSKAYDYLVSTNKVENFIFDNYVFISSEFNWLMISNYDFDSMYFFFKNNKQKEIIPLLKQNKNFVDLFSYIKNDFSTLNSSPR